MTIQDTTTRRTDEELWAALADPTVQARVNERSRVGADTALTAPEWRDHILNCIETVLNDIGDPATPREEWTRCGCGKIYSETELEAQRKAAYANREHGRYAPTRYYRCPKGGYHWAEKYVTVKDCDCGHRSYIDHRAASKAAERRNKKPRANGLDARAFQCKHGGYHVVLYPIGENLRQCDCGDVCYKSIALADILLNYLDEEHPGIYEPYKCAEHRRVHVGPKAHLPAGATIIGDDEEDD